MDVSANITGIKYSPCLCSQLQRFDYSELGDHFASTAFILNRDSQNSVAMSWWVSPKRTRSYPYARVYDTLGFSGKKITVIPIFKDEGIRGDRDFLQWDTVSLMSLLNIHVIIGYYVDAEESSRFPSQKITKQKFDMQYIKDEIEELTTHQSGALHWNLLQVTKAGSIGERAIECYTKISRNLNVEMHSLDSALDRIKKLREGSAEFMDVSRSLAKAAQLRESITIQPKERVAGNKGIITVRNYLGGEYYLTLDEVETSGDDLYLIEAKHSSRSMLPSNGDIKDALIKMLLFTNLKDVHLDGKSYNPVPTLKLTGAVNFNQENLTTSQKRFWKVLTEKEAKLNGFRVKV